MVSKHGYDGRLYMNNFISAVYGAIGFGGGKIESSSESSSGLFEAAVDSGD